MVPKFFKNRSRSGLKGRFCFSSVLKPIYKGFWRQNGLTIASKIDRKICGQRSDVENAGSMKNATPTTFWTLFFILEKNISIMMSKSDFVSLIDVWLIVC